MRRSLGVSSNLTDLRALPTQQDVTAPSGSTGLIHRSLNSKDDLPNKTEFKENAELKKTAYSELDKQKENKEKLRQALMRADAEFAKRLGREDSTKQKEKMEALFNTHFEDKDEYPAIDMDTLVGDEQRLLKISIRLKMNIANALLKQYVESEKILKAEVIKSQLIMHSCVFSISDQQTHMALKKIKEENGRSGTLEGLPKLRSYKSIEPRISLHYEKFAEPALIWLNAFITQSKASLKLFPTYPEDDLANEKPQAQQREENYSRHLLASRSSC